MTAPVKLSRWTAETLLELVDEYTEDGALPPYQVIAVEKLKEAFEASTKPKRPGPQARKSAKKKRDRIAINREVHDLVEARANGLCEACAEPFALTDPMEMDHLWGRAKAPTLLENCWGLHSQSCGMLKTHNKPSRAYWLRRFREHAERHGYTAQVRKVDQALDSLRLSDEAASVGRAAR